MDIVRRTLRSFLTRAAHKGIKALDPQCQCAKQLGEIEDVELVIAEEIETICRVATLPEITRIFLLTARLKKTEPQKREAIKTSLKKTANILAARIESQSGPLRLPKACRYLLLGI